jgi:hypothetical protein
VHLGWHLHDNVWAISAKQFVCNWVNGITEFINELLLGSTFNHINPLIATKIGEKLTSFSLDIILLDNFKEAASGLFNYGTKTFL